MLEINSIKIFLSNLINNIDKKFTFYSDCMEELKKYDKKEIHKIKKKSFLLEPIRLYLLNNIDKYSFIISKNKYKNCTYIKYKFNEFEKNNFFINLELTEKLNSDILKLSEINIKELLFSKKFDNIIYFNIIEKKNILESDNYIIINNYYDTISFLLGIESINILKFQRFDRIQNFLKNKDGYKIYEILQNYNNLIHKLSYEERDKYIIHSGAVLEALGTTYTRDVDVFIFNLKSPYDAKMKLKELKTNLLDMDPNIIDNNGDYHTNIDEKPLKYKKQWITYQLPSTDNAKDIYDVNTNNVFHFYFAGMKFFNINLTINRFLQRSSISSMADLLMLKELNNIDLKDRICLPNMTIRQGRLVVFYGEYLEKYYNSLQKALKNYYNKDYSIDELKKLVKHCNSTGFDIYKGNMEKDTDTDIIKYFHILIKKELIKIYGKNVNYLLDIGSGKLTDMRIWEENSIKNVVGIEPSLESIKLGEERYKKFGFNGNLDVINGVGDEDWENSKYTKVISNKYDVVTFQFTLHYMINNIDIIINNLKKIMNNRCKIIITCMDGNKIHNEFIKNEKIEIRNDQEPIFAIVPLYTERDRIPKINNNILVYFKGAYGVSSGSIEPIIDINKLINIFKENKIILINKTNFSDYNLHVKKKMSNIQLKVSSYYMSLIFEYKN
jgi:SAM-dependent methyltransferase